MSEEIVSRLAVIETKIEVHERLEDNFWDKMDNKLESLEAKFMKELNSLEDSVEALKTKQARDNGFMAGMVFILTGVGAVAGAVGAYVFK